MFFDEDLYGAEEAADFENFDGAAFMEEDEEEEEPDLTEVYDFGAPAEAGHGGGTAAGSGPDGPRDGDGGGPAGSPAASTSRMAPSTSGGSQRRRRGSRGSGSGGGSGTKPRWRSGHIPAPPSFDGNIEQEPFCLRHYRRALTRWVTITKEYPPANEQALRALDALTGDAALELEEVEDSRYNTEHGISTLLADLEISFGEKELFRKGGLIREFESLVRMQGESVNAFVRRFRLMERKLKDAQLPQYPEETRAVKLLDGLKLEERATAQLLLAAGNKYNFRFSGHHLGVRLDEWPSELPTWPCQLPFMQHQLPDVWAPTASPVKAQELPSARHPAVRPPLHGSEGTSSEMAAQLACSFDAPDGLRAECLEGGASLLRHQPEAQLEGHGAPPVHGPLDGNYHDDDCSGSDGAEPAGDDQVPSQSGQLSTRAGIPQRSEREDLRLLRLPGSDVRGNTSEDQSKGQPFSEDSTRTKAKAKATGKAKAKAHSAISDPLSSGLGPSWHSWQDSSSLAELDTASFHQQPHAPDAGTTSPRAATEHGQYGLPQGDYATTSGDGFSPFWPEVGAAELAESEPSSVGRTMARSGVRVGNARLRGRGPRRGAAGLGGDVDTWFA